MSNSCSELSLNQEKPTVRSNQSTLCNYTRKKLTVDCRCLPWAWSFGSAVRGLCFRFRSGVYCCSGTGNLYSFGHGTIVPCECRPILPPENTVLGETEFSWGFNPDRITAVSKIGWPSTATWPNADPSTKAHVAWGWISRGDKAIKSINSIEKQFTEMRLKSLILNLGNLSLARYSCQRQ